MTEKPNPYDIFDNPVPSSSFDAADAKSVNVSRQQAARRDAVKAEVIVAIMGNEKCREWVGDLLAMCNIFMTPFEADPYSTAFNAGKQFIGNLILADIIAGSPEQYAHMCRERIEREEKELDEIKKAAQNK